MKNIFLKSILIALIAMYSCETNFPVSLGFDSEIQQNSEGKVLVYVNPKIKTIYLQGSLSINEGATEVSLVNPHEEIVFNSLIDTPGQTDVDKKFSAVPGTWKLQYRSHQSEGFINLHVNY